MRSRAKCHAQARASWHVVQVRAGGYFEVRVAPVEGLITRWLNLGGLGADAPTQHWPPFSGSQVAFTPIFKQPARPSKARVKLLASTAPAATVLPHAGVRSSMRPGGSMGDNREPNRYGASSKRMFCRHTSRFGWWSTALQTAGASRPPPAHSPWWRLSSAPAAATRNTRPSDEAYHRLLAILTPSYDAVPACLQFGGRCVTHAVSARTATRQGRTPRPAFRHRSGQRIA